MAVFISSNGFPILEIPFPIIRAVGVFLFSQSARAASNFPLDI